MLKEAYQELLPEAGCDEAGRGCLAGPVFAAAVILPPGFSHPHLNDSKLMTRAQRLELRTVIETQALAWAVAMADHHEIDKINILQASILAMHRALDLLKSRPEFIIVDGNRFKPYPGVPSATIVKGDAKFSAIAAASVLAKTHRDAFMEDLHSQFPQYNWISNKGYATSDHRDAILKYGYCTFHRKSFRLKGQLKLKF